jgi:hypothetical protein
MVGLDGVLASARTIRAAALRELTRAQRNIDSQRASSVVQMALRAWRKGNGGTARKTPMYKKNSSSRLVVMMAEERRALDLRVQASQPVRGEVMRASFHPEFGWRPAGSGCSAVLHLATVFSRC